jgi:dTDP-6-deoxy-L-talose 4-dehydrogenase (NAD+)
LKIAVTGATGFIGRHLIDELERRGCHAVLAARQIPKDHARDRTWVPMDITAPPEDPFAALDYPDCVIHLAWRGLPNYRSHRHIDEELPQQYRFLKTLLSRGLGRVIVAGTCLEYGMQDGCLNEDMPTAPTTPYGFAKDALRRQLQFLQREISFSLLWVRMFYLFGEGQNPASIYSQFHAAVRSNEAMFNMSGGEQLRDFLPIGNATRILVDLALSGSGEGIVNVCSGSPISIRDLVESWRATQSSSIRLNLGYYPYPDYESMAFWGDNRKLLQLLRRTSFGSDS